MFFQQCFDEIDKQYDETYSREKKLSRDDWAHGSLLIVNELLRCSNVEGEVRYVSVCMSLINFVVHVLLIRIFSKETVCMYDI